MDKERKRPSIFEMVERYMERMFEEMKAFPRSLSEDYAKRKKFGDIEDWLRDPFEEMLKEFEKEVPEKLKNFVMKEETPSGKIRRYGPFIYGFSYTMEPGKEPEIKEFGNVRPSYRKIEPHPEGEREPLIDVIEQKDFYEVVAELPGVEKGEIKLNATENLLEIKATGSRKFYKDISFESPIKPESAKATYKNGVLSVKVTKKEGEKKTSISLD